MNFVTFEPRLSTNRIKSKTPQQRKDSPVFLQRGRTCSRAGRWRRFRRSIWRRWGRTWTTGADRIRARFSPDCCPCWPSCGPSATRTARCASASSSRTKSCQFSSPRSGTWHPSSPVADPRRLIVLFHRESASRPERSSWTPNGAAERCAPRGEPPVLVRHHHHHHHHHATAWPD